MDGYIGSINMIAYGWAPNGWLLCQGQQVEISQYTALYSLISTLYGGDSRTYFNLPDLRGRVPMGAGHGVGSQYNFLLAQAFGKEAATATGLVSCVLPQHTHENSVVGSATATPTVTSSMSGYVAPTMQVVGAAGSQANPVANSFLGGVLTTGSPGTHSSVLYVPGTPTPTGLVPLGGFNAGSPGTPNVTVSVDVAVDVDINNAAAGVANPVAPFSVSVPTFQPSLAINYIICTNGLYPDRP